jgi:hypothetical protein
MEASIWPSLRKQARQERNAFLLASLDFRTMPVEPLHDDRMIWIDGFGCIWGFAKAITLQVFKQFNMETGGKSRKFAWAVAWSCWGFGDSQNSKEQLAPAVSL